MKTVVYTTDALAALRKHRNVAQSIVAKIRRYADSSVGDIKKLTGSTGKRLRVGEYRVIFEESADRITVTVIGPRGSIYKQER